MHPVETNVIRKEYTRRPAWMGDWPHTIQIRPKAKQIGYKTAAGTFVVEQYKTQSKFEQEANYCHLWRINGGQCNITEVTK